MKPKISIVMPCYNAAAHVGRAIDSVEAQDFTDWELIAIDDGSSDGTLAELQRCDQPRMRVVSQRNAGVSAARNAGIALARGTYMAFLDSDDEWDPSFLGRMVAALAADPEAGLVYCGWRNVGLPGRSGEPFVPPDYERPDKLEVLLRGNRWPIHACLTYTDLVRRAGGFDPRFAVGEDFLLWLEIGCFHRVVVVPAVLARYIHHGGEQATRDRVRAARQVLQVQRAFLERHPEVARRLGPRKVNEATSGVLLQRAYEAFWGEDLVVAQQIFRMALVAGGWGTRDLRYLLASLLPRVAFQAILAMRDRG